MNMSDKNAHASGSKGIMPQRVSTRVALAVAIGLAFSLGALLFSGAGSSGESTQSSHEQTETSRAEMWTCSMHPQIKLPKPGKCPLCFMDLIPLEIGIDDDLGPRQLKMSKAAKQNARIVTTEARRMFAESEIRMMGKLTYDETKLSYITAWVPGRLDRLYADFTGVLVQKGDHMVNIYSPVLLATQEELLQAKIAATELAGSSEILKTTARQMVDAAREKLRLYGLSKTQIAQIEKTGEVSEHLSINAPIGGVVVHKNAVEGMYVETGTRIYTIADLSQLWVIFEAYESDLPWLRYGQSVTFSTLSFPGKVFSAKITFIDPIMDKTTRTVNVRAIFDNSKNQLKPEMFVSGVVKSRINSAGEVVDENLIGKWIGPMHPEVVKNGPGDCDVCGMALVSAASLGYATSIDTDETALVIPATAPLITGARAIVYVELPDREEPVFEGRVVILGPRAGDMYVVISGIQEGERVVVNGAFKIDAELQIRAQPSMMLPEGGAGQVGHQHGGMKTASRKSVDAAPNHADELNHKQSGEISQDARSALTPVYRAYFAIQAALAGDDYELAVDAYTQFAKSIKQVDMALFTGDAHMRWMMISDSLSGYGNDGKAAEKIAAARQVFLGLSKSLIALEKSFGHADGQDYFLAFCPMADKNRGAYWIQTTDIINNSFFGASMLRCGSIKETFQPKGS